MRTLLIADDERTIREGLAASIDWESCGISRVLLAADGREAYETIKRERPDIVIIDIVMPEMTGMEVIARLRDEGGGPEFVIISGYGEFDYAQEAIRHHVKNYILKPCDIDEIANTITKLVAHIDHQQSIERERLHLKEHVDLLMPQAQEQILRGFLTGATPGGRELFRDTFGHCGEELRLLLFCLNDNDDYAKLPILRRCVDGSHAMPGWSRSAILHDCVVLFFDAQAGTGIKEAVVRVCKAAVCSAIAGIRAAVSGPGTVEDLPAMYKKAREAMKLHSPLAGNEAPEAVPLVDASVAQYCRTIQQVMQYVQENLGDSSLSLHHIAMNVLYLNPDYLGKLFKKECGVKFSDYLMAARMERAKQIMAASSGFKMYEVARQVGLGDNAAYFGQVFRKYTGMLPSEYRMKHGV